MIKPGLLSELPVIAAVMKITFYLSEPGYCGVRTPLLCNISTLAYSTDGAAVAAPLREKAW